MTPNRDEALKIFREHNDSESLYRHALAVEAVMRHFAVKYGEDPDKWGVIGLVHDLDWDRWPEDHCVKTAEILREAGWPEDWIRSIQSHAWGIVTDVEPQHIMEKVLFTIDELTGLVHATALMRPTRITDLTSKSVKKKWNNKNFSAGVNREIIDKGAAMMGMERTQIIDETITAMQTIAEELGLLA